MRIRIAAVVLVATAALTSCQSSDDGKSSRPPVQAAPATRSATPSVDISALELAAGIPPEPTGAKLTALLDGLRDIDPALTAKPDRAVRNARNQCQSLNQGDTSGHTAAVRFGTDTHPLADIQGTVINGLLISSLCPLG